MLPFTRHASRITRHTSHVTGTSNTGQLLLLPRNCHLLAPCLHTLPKPHFGIKDDAFALRNRHLDLLVHQPELSTPNRNSKPLISNPKPLISNPEPQIPQPCTGQPALTHIPRDTSCCGQSCEMHGIVME